MTTRFMRLALCVLVVSMSLVWVALGKTGIALLTYLAPALIMAVGLCCDPDDQSSWLERWLAVLFWPAAVIGWALADWWYAVDQENDR